MAVSLGTYLGVTAIVAVVIALQIALKGSISLLVLLAFFNAALVAMFNMQLKYEPPLPTALVFLPAVALAVTFTVGMILS